MIEKQFIPYYLALKMKELGFDEPCFGNYVDPKILVIEVQQNQYKQVTFKTHCLAPLWQQCFDWFESQYRLLAYIFPTPSRNTCIVSIHKLNTDNIFLPLGQLITLETSNKEEYMPLVIEALIKEVYDFQNKTV